MTRIAVVTGGASGIGLGVGRQLAADGHFPGVDVVAPLVPVRN